jgi:hypothetical protein
MSHCDGALRILSDVTVRHMAEGDLVVISDKPRTCGEVLTLELMNGTLVRTHVRVESSMEVVERGTIQHELRLVRLEPIYKGPGLTTAAENPMVRRFEAGRGHCDLSTLVEEVPVRVLNCSATGCLLEGGQPVAAGTIAAFKMSMGSETFSEVVKVTRCRATGLPPGIRHLAARFLSITPPYPGSLRQIMRPDWSQPIGWYTASRG